MKLLVLTEDFYPEVSGGAHLKWRFCQIAAERGHEVVVYTHRSGEAPKREIVEGIRIRRPFKLKPDSLPAQAALAFPFRLLFSVALCFYLMVSLKNSQMDGIYTGSNTLHWVGKVLARWTGATGVSFVGYTPSLDTDGSVIKRALEWISFRYALCSTIYCQNSEIKNRIRNISGRNPKIAHGILNSENVRDAHKQAVDGSTRERYASAEQTLLVFVGRLTEIKNVPAAIDTLATLPCSYRLVIVGDGPERDDIEYVVSRRGLEARVQFVGEVEHARALSITAIADGLVLPSRTESYPTAAFEGLALNCEVFATPVGILLEIDHPRLHLQPANRFGDAIRSTEFSGTRGFDEEALQAYSVKRYTDTILTAFEEQRRVT